MDVEVRGLDHLAHLSSALRSAGEEGKGLRRELYAGVNRATKPIRKDLTAQILPTLPRRGGLAQQVKRETRLATSTRSSRNAAGVRIVVRGRRRRTLQSATTQGTFRHPVFPDPTKSRSEWTWVTQSVGVRPGLLEHEFERDKPEARKEVLFAIERVNNQIERSIK